jgi:thiamine monophosphate kinase
LATCREHRVPRTAALLGAAGEYELLLAVPSAQRHRFSGEAQNGCFQRIGYAESSEQAGLYFHFSENTTKQISQAPPDPRTCISREDYIRALLALASELQET